MQYIPTKHERNYAYLGFAKALESKVKHGKHCAILYNSKEKILFVNEYSFMDGKQCSVHAEQGVILQFQKKYPNKDISNYTMMVIRGNIYGEFTLSKPCVKCYSCIISSGIRKVVYSTKGTFSFECISI